MGDNDIPEWAKPWLEVARREGVRLDDPKQAADFMRRAMEHIAAQAEARGVSDRVGGVEPWQIHELQKTLVQPLLERLRPLLDEPPQSVLFVLEEHDDGVRARYATDQAIDIRATLEDGTVLTEQAVATIVDTDSARSPRFVGVEPIVPWQGFFLWFSSLPHYTHRLLAWDIRPLLAVRPVGVLRELLRMVATTGVVGARSRRREQLHRLSHSERLDVLRDAMALDVMEPGVRRMPLRGLIQAGHAVTSIDSCEGTVNPYRLLDFVDTLLEERLVVPFRQGKGVEEAELDLLLPHELPKNRLDNTSKVEAHASARSLVEKHLVGEERAAVLTFLEAEYEGVTAQEYCDRVGRSYEAVKRAHTRGKARLKQLVDRERH